MKRLGTRAGLALRYGAVVLLLGGLLAGCGGGGGTGDSSASSGTAPGGPVTTPVRPGLVADCSGPACGALDATRYAGQGVGVWQYSNDSAQPVELSLQIDGIPGKDVQLVLTNHGAVEQALPALALYPRSALPLQWSRIATLHGLERRSGAPRAGSRHLTQQAWASLQLERTRQQPDGRSRQRDARVQARTMTIAAQLGDARDWWVDAASGNEDSSVRNRRAATLLRQQPVADGSRRINLWVVDEQYRADRISDAMLDRLMQQLVVGPNSVYRMVTGLAGAPWGTHDVAELIGPQQDVDILIAGDLVDPADGYFSPADAWLDGPSGDPAYDAYLGHSNEALSIVLRAESFYQAGPIDGMQLMTSALAHELLHLVNFYQRSVRPPASQAQAFQPWLEEMTAMMMEDVIAERLGFAFHPIRDGRLLSGLYWGEFGGFNCTITVFTMFDPDNPCYSYDSGGSFGAYLLRQYGIGFYQRLLRNLSTSDSWRVLDNALQQAGGEGAQQALRRFGASIALLPAAGSPAGFGFPARSEAGYTLLPLDGAYYRPSPRLPTTLPASLAPLGFFPLVRPQVQGSYRETLRLPPRTSVTVVVR
ncbi:hypothetical protein OL229_18620 [Neisseriaceae bacterium JH1-16]|nr:hypothetical protein [Neisseriaceae bacterium JH1-16]